MAAFYAEYVVMEIFCAIAILQARNADDSTLYGRIILIFFDVYKALVELNDN